MTFLNVNFVTEFEEKGSTSRSQDLPAPSATKKQKWTYKVRFQELIRNLKLSEGTSSLPVSSSCSYLSLHSSTVNLAARANLCDCWRLHWLLIPGSSSKIIKAFFEYASEYPSCTWKVPRKFAYISTGGLAAVTDTDTGTWNQGLPRKLKRSAWGSYCWVYQIANALGSSLFRHFESYQQVRYLDQHNIVLTCLLTHRWFLK